MRKMTIDSLPLVAKGGISNYVRPLVEALIAGDKSGWQFELFFRLGFLRKRGRCYRMYREQYQGQHVKERTTAVPDRVVTALWERGVFLPAFSANGRGDLFLATTDLVPKCRDPGVGWIVYDLTPLRIPEYFERDSAAYAADMKARSNRADFIIAISQTTKNDIVELLNYPEERIAIVYPGAQAAVGQCVRMPLDIKRPYVYYIGGLARNKNIDGMLRIFASCVNKYGLDYDIVLSGKDFCGEEYLDCLTHELGIRERVHITGWVCDDERDALLSNARMLWQFSWYEGFGLPTFPMKIAQPADNPVSAIHQASCPNTTPPPPSSPPPLHRPDQSPGPDCTIFLWLRLYLNKGQEFLGLRLPRSAGQTLRTRKTAKACAHLTAVHHVHHHTPSL